MTIDRRLPVPRFIAYGTLSLIAIAVVAVAALWYRPVLRPGPAIPNQAFALPAPVEGMRLHVFNTGMNRMSWLLVGDARPWRPNTAFVIAHPSRGLIVFDTGLSKAVAEHGEAAYPVPLRYLMESIGRPDRTLDAQMIEAGLDPKAVRFVILSHLHDDHTGRITAFPNATVIAGPQSDAALADLAPAAQRRVLTFQKTASLPPFDASVDLFGDGSLQLVAGGGHTAEDLMALVALPDGPVLLAGDAIVHRDWLMSDDVQRVPVDPDRAAVVRNQVRTLLRGVPRLTLFPGHDTPPVPTREDITLHQAHWFALSAWTR